VVATVFGLIVTLGAWINGRMTRKVLLEHFERITRVMNERFWELIKQHNELIKQHQELIRQHNELMKTLNKRFDELIKQHNELIKQHNEILRRLGG